MSFITDSYGQILGRGGDPHERHYYFNGMTVGQVSNNGTADFDYAESIAQHTAAPPSQLGPFRGGATTGTPYADFDQSYEPLNGSNYETMFSRYTVQAGDTLSSIAHALWGDASLWFTIADANGLFGSEILEAGRSLIIPNKVHNFHNNADTYRVHDPNDAIGDNAPTAPRPKFSANNDGWGLLGQVLLLVIAIVVTIALPQLFPATFAAMGPVLGSAAAAAGGSIASQGVGLATGIQRRFDWGQVATAAITAGVTKGLGTGFGATGASAFERLGIGGSGLLDQFAQGAVSNAVSQGIGLATGLQRKFDWTGVAAAGAVRGTANEVGIGILGRDPNADVFAVDMISGMAGAIAGATTRTLMQGTDFGDNLIAVLPDVIGSTIGNSIAKVASPPIVLFLMDGGAAVSSSDAGSGTIATEEVVIEGPTFWEQLVDDVKYGVGVAAGFVGGAVEFIADAGLMVYDGLLGGPAALMENLGLTIPSWAPNLNRQILPLARGAKTVIDGTTDYLGRAARGETNPAVDAVALGSEAAEAIRRDNDARAELRAIDPYAAGVNDGHRAFDFFSVGAPAAGAAVKVTRAMRIAHELEAAAAGATATSRATFGMAKTANYKKTFFDANPTLRGKVIVHHAVERQTLKLYPSEVTASEINSLENLRGIPFEANSRLHLSVVRKEWSKFYLENPRATKADLLQKATEIDGKYGTLFNPPVGR